MKKQALIFLLILSVLGIITLGVIYYIENNKDEKVTKKYFIEEFDKIDKDMIKTCGKKFVSENGYEFEFMCYCYDEYTKVAYLELDVKGKDINEANIKEENDYESRPSLYFYDVDKYFCITVGEYNQSKQISDYKFENGVLRLFYFIPFDEIQDDKFDGTVYLYDVKIDGTESEYELLMDEIGRIKMENTCNKYYEENGMKISSFGIVLDRENDELIFPVVEYYGERISVIDVFYDGKIDNDNIEYEKLDEHIKEYCEDFNKENLFPVYKNIDEKEVYIFKFPIDIEKITYLGKQ